MQIEAKLEALGLVLPAPPKLPPGVQIPFQWVRIHGTHAYIAGHGALNADGTPAGPFGKVGADLTPEQGYAAARLTALAVLGSLKHALGDLDRVAAWLRVFGMVNTAPGFTNTPNVISGFSHLILELYGSGVGAHARSAIGVAELPGGIPVEIEAEIAIHPEGR
jgi:enamine deaminase RidA (YjgF/YER057c/UK114 family)